MSVKISFIVPFKNEEKYLEKCISSLVTQAKYFECEIILIDNGSNDRSRQIAMKFEDSLKYLFIPYGTVASLRNQGARDAKGEWLVFVDGDVELSEDWGRNLIAYFEKQGENPFIITGSTCVPASTATWIESVWFENLRNRDRASDNYINSGHLIIHSTLFKKLGGFTDLLETGEDEDLCKRAKDIGAIIYKNEKLVAIHHGYPKTIREFYQREKWHGKDIVIKLNNRDFQIAIMMIAVVITTIAILFVNDRIGYLFIPGTVLYLLILGFALSRVQFGLRKGFSLSFLFFVYGIAKTASVIRKMRIFLRKTF